MWRPHSARAKITGVWLTHSHADFVAGHIEFAGRLNVPIRISGKASAEYEHIALQEGDTLAVGSAVIRFLETPGHTLDSMCGVVANSRAASRPLALLTGDTLFVRGVGRPDLLGKDLPASALASQMFDSWTQKLSKLPDDVIVLPAHGAGSLCGARLSDEPSSTIGAERTQNSYLQHTSRGEFVAAILSGLPTAPQYFGHNAAMNRQGPELVQWELDELPSIEPTADLTNIDQHYVVDLRDATQYAMGHIPNSVNIALRGRFETWTGTMVPWTAALVVTGDEAQLREAIARLHRVGYHARAVMFDSWIAAGLPTTRNQMVTPPQLYQQMQGAESPLVVDVRLPREWQGFRIGTVLNIPVTELAAQAHTLDHTVRVVAVCNSAYRSSLAVGLLERLGFERASSLEGGGEAWEAAGLPVIEILPGDQHANTGAQPMVLGERMDAAELNRLMLDLPGAIRVVDVRPAEQFADYHLPGSENVPIDDLMHGSVSLVDARQLIIVDRDGSVAMMVAAILSQRSARPTKALYGGLQRYWDEVGVGAAARAGAPAVAPRAARSERSSPARPATPARPTRRSAGC